MALLFAQYTMTATATKLTTAMGLSAGTKVRNVDILGKSSNTGHIYGGGSTVTNAPANAGVDIAPGAGWSSGPYSLIFPHGTDDIYIVGTASDIAFITAVT